jgi:glucose-6-phosphate 1-epimerase
MRSASLHKPLSTLTCEAISIGFIDDEDLTMTTPQADALAKKQLSAANGAAVTFYPHGGHITSWITSDGRERLFLSERTEMHPGAPIRGGVPIAFPQFSKRGPLPPHGFARIMPWTVVDTHVGPSGTAVAHLQLLASDATRQMWDHDFQLDLLLAVGGMQLSITLQVTNTGDETFSFTSALHTYFRVSSIDTVTVKGLRGLDYCQFDQNYHQSSAELRIEGEVDRIYWGVPGTITLHDGEDTIQVTAEGYPDAVVWNPGPDKSAALADMAADDYRHMLCIESAAIGQAVTLAPMMDWRGTQHLVVGG